MPCCLQAEAAQASRIGRQMGGGSGSGCGCGRTGGHRRLCRLEARPVLGGFKSPRLTLVQVLPQLLLQVDGRLQQGRDIGWSTAR